MTRRVVSALLIAASLCAAPSAAIAVNVSSSDGFGFQYRTASYNNGAYAEGRLTSTAGKTVYYQGLVDYNLPCSNSYVGKYTGTTTSKTGIAMGGAIKGAYGYGCGAPRVNSRVARSISGLPDPHGSWSADF